ncbi:alpha amylase C-terminal domain-containing protein [Algoriphagus hitonicola]|uniref:alpha amylase C-terminal domain-containing protein n=1 Tax=Algoriphagus hitonicola TaxID=435880 RepID=UPI00361ACA80
MMGEYMELHSFNRSQNPAFTDKAFAFARWDKSQKLIVVCNFDEFQSVKTTLKLSPELMKAWNLELGEREIKEVMFGKKTTKLRVTDAGAEIDLDFGPWESAVFEVR